MVLLFARRFVGTALALVVGTLAAIVVFFGPIAVTGNEEVLLLWGWITGVLALPAAFFAGRLAHSTFNAQLSGYSTTGTTTWRRFLGVSIAAIVLVATISYFILTYGDREVRWSEEVALGDGTTVLITRRVKGSAFGHPAARPEDWLPSVYELDLSALPSHSDAPVWRGPLRPILLEKVPSGNWIVLTEPRLCGEWYKLGRPAPAYRADELKGGKWTLVEVPRELIGRRANLLFTPRFTFEDPRLSAAEVLRRNTEHRRKDDWPVVEAVSGCQ